MISADHRTGAPRLLDGWTLLCFALFVLLSLLVNQALLAHFSQRAPVFPPWSLQEMHTQAWMIHSLLEDPRALPHLNYFYPSCYTIALGEPRVGVALLGLPAYLLGKGFTGAFNLAFLLAFPLCALGGFLMCRAATRSVAAALVGGVVFGYGPYMLNHLGQIVLLYSMFVPVGLAAAWYYGKRPTLRAALLLGLLGALQVIASMHFATYLFYGACVLLGASLLVHGNWRRPRPWINLGIGGAVSFAAAGWLILPFLQGKNRHSFVENTMTSIQPFYSDFANLLLPSSFYGPLANTSEKINQLTHSNIWTLFPGLAAVALSVVWFGHVASRREDLRGRHVLGLCTWLLSLLTALWLVALVPKQYSDLGLLILGSVLSMGILGVWIFVGVRLGAVKILQAFWRGATTFERTIALATLIVYLVALGPVVHYFGSILGLGPGAVAFKLIPGFSLARVPSRIVVLGGAAFALFSALGFSVLASRLSRLQTNILAAFVVWIVILGFPPGSTSEMRQEVLKRSHAPVKLDRQGVPQIYTWVASLPGVNPLLTLPLPPDRTAAQSLQLKELESLYMYFSLRHFQPLVVGISSYAPTDYRTVRMPLVRAFPDERSLAFFEGQGVQYALFHKHFYQPGQWPNVRARIAAFPGRLRLVREEGGVAAYQLLRAARPARSCDSGGDGDG